LELIKMLKSKEEYFQEITQFYQQNNILFLEEELLSNTLSTIFDKLKDEKANEWLNSSNSYLHKTPLEELKSGANNPKLNIDSVNNAYILLVK